MARDSVSKTLISVALYALVINRKHLLGIVVDFDAGSELFFPAPFGECHKENPYIIARRITAVYCLALLLLPRESGKFSQCHRPRHHLRWFCVMGKRIGACS